MNNPISYYDPSGHSATIIGLIIGTIIGAGVRQASNTSDKLGISGWKKFWYSVSGLFVGDFLVSLDNWCTIRKTIMMNPKKEYNFKFDQNPFYSFWNAPLYAIYLKNHQYKDEDSRTTLGLYLELQAHYLFYLVGNSHATNGADMGPTDIDDTGKLFEAIASGIKNSITGMLPKIWFI